MNRKQCSPAQQVDQSEDEIDWSLLNPYDVIQMHNYKLFQFRKGEIYPSIRPPISVCDPEQTADWFAKTMEENYGSFDPRKIKKGNIASNAENVIENNVGRSIKERLNFGCGFHKHQEPQEPQEQLVKHREAPQMVLDWSQATPYDLMRLQNCKPFNFQEHEAYPNIKPPISQCSPELTAEWFAEAIEDNGCDHRFDMEQDDVVELWKRSPDKHTLSYYGVGTDIHKPEAVIFNQVVSECLEKAAGRKQKARFSKEDDKPPHFSKDHLDSLGPSGDFVLNRQLLESKITKMPIVKKKLNPSNALSWIHCPHSTQSCPSNFDNQLTDKLGGTIDMSKQVFKRRQSKLGEDECETYKVDPLVYDAFNMEVEDRRNEARHQPSNYEELFSQLISCFEKYPSQDPLSKAYATCCKKSPKRRADATADGDRRHGSVGGPKGSSNFGAGKEEGIGAGGEGTGDGLGGEGGASGEASRGDIDGGLGTGGVGGPVGGTTGGAGGPTGGTTGGAGGTTGGATGGTTGGTTGGAGGASGGVGGASGGESQSTKIQEFNDTGNELKQNQPRSSGNKHKKKDKSLSEVGQSSKKTGKTRGEKKIAVAVPPGKPKKMLPSFMTDRPDDSVEYNKLSTDGTTRLSGEKLETGTIGPEGKIRLKEGELLKEEGQVKKTKKKGGRKGKRLRLRQAKTKAEADTKPHKECPCEICEFMNRRKMEQDPPFIREMLNDIKRRQLIDYYKRKCHRDYLKCKDAEYPSPQHKCAPLEGGDNCFCLSPNITLQFDRLSALQQLQQILAPTECDILDCQLRNKVKALKNRLCQRLCDSL